MKQEKIFATVGSLLLVVALGALLAGCSPEQTEATDAALAQTSASLEVAQSVLNDIEPPLRALVKSLGYIELPAPTRPDGTKSPTRWVKKSELRRSQSATYNPATVEAFRTTDPDEPSYGFVPFEALGIPEDYTELYSAMESSIEPGEPRVSDTHHSPTVEDSSEPEQKAEYRTTRPSPSSNESGKANRHENGAMDLGDFF